jgi:hypothetical protein
LRAASVKQAGLKLDKHAPNALGPEVANAHVHASSGDVPAERLTIEREKLQHPVGLLSAVQYPLHERHLPTQH